MHPTAIGTITRGALTLTALSALLLLSAGGADAQTETLLYSFQGTPDGASPSHGTVIIDKDGNLYGATTAGGAYNLGTVWKLTPAGAETVLWSFGNGADGAWPVDLVMDRSGNLYGTTYQGGAHSLGTVFEITAAGTEKVLWNFGNGTDGTGPSEIVRDDSGNLYGTTLAGGIHNIGTVFEITPSGTETVLWSFEGTQADQGQPYGLMLAKSGNLFGTSYGQSLKAPYFYGQVWEVTGQQHETVLHSFAVTEGFFPSANVVMDKAGNLFGTCHTGGPDGVGTVFKVTPSGTETVFHAFNPDTDGGDAYNDTAIDRKGNLYGTTYQGYNNGGTVWKLTPSGKEKILHTFSFSRDGYHPFAGVVLDKSGNIYGTTQDGGANHLGTVYKVTP